MPCLCSIVVRGSFFATGIAFATCDQTCAALRVHACTSSRFHGGMLWRCGLMLRGDDGQANRPDRTEDRVLPSRVPGLVQPQLAVSDRGQGLRCVWLNRRINEATLSGAAESAAPSRFYLMIARSNNIVQHMNQQ